MSPNAESKPLGSYDQSGFDFVQEMLDGDRTAAINFDRLQNHPQAGYIMFEYLLCEENQKVTPHTSHPNRYWNKNSMKFLSLWQAKLALHATLFLVNYAKAGTAHADEVKLIRVTDVSYSGLRGEEFNWTRSQFRAWFRELNQACLTGRKEVLEEISRMTSMEVLEQTALNFGKYNGRTFREVADFDPAYLEWLAQQSTDVSHMARVYLQRKAQQ